MIKIIYLFLFIHLYVIGGLLIFLGIATDRPVFYGLWPLLTLIKYKYSNKNVLFIFFVLILYITLLGLFKGIEVNRIFSFILQPIFTFSFFLICVYYIDKNNYIKIFKILLIIGLLQLPIVIIQRFGYNYLIRYSEVRISDFDFQFGTFWTVNDVGMTFTVNLLLVLILFNKSCATVVKNSFLYSIVYSVIILISGSNLSCLVLVLIWIVYFLRNLKARNILKVIFISIIFSFIVFKLVQKEEGSTKVDFIRKQIDKIDSSDQEIFLNGKFARGAAINYYLNQHLIIFGDGPGYYAYKEGSEQIMILGLKGHIFLYYAETGLIGLMMSYLFLLVIAKAQSLNGNYKRYYMVIMVYTLTVVPMYNLAMLLSFNTIIRIDGLFKESEKKSLGI